MDHSYYLVIQLIGKNTQRSITFCSLFSSWFSLLFFTCFFYLSLQYTVLWEVSLMIFSHFPLGFSLLLLPCLFFSSPLHIFCTSFSLFLREGVWTAFKTLLELWQLLHLNFKGLDWRRESNKSRSRDLNLLFVKAPLWN